MLNGRWSIGECIVLRILVPPRREMGENHSLKDWKCVKFRKECIKFTHVEIPQLVRIPAGALNDMFSILIWFEATWATVSVALLPPKHVVSSEKITHEMFDELSFELGAHSFHSSFKRIPIYIGRLERAQPVVPGPEFQDGAICAMKINVLVQIIVDEFIIEDDIPGSPFNHVLGGLPFMRLYCSSK
jgi:hypothetical protein